MPTNPVSTTTPTIQAPQAPTYTPALATASTYNPTPYKVEPAGLVQERLKGIVAQDSPLMQQAATISDQKMNDRGLRSSSMAVGAGQQAVIASALPIAQQDATSINEAMTNTANQQNAASQYAATAKNNVALANQAATNDAGKSTQAAQVQLDTTALQGTIQLANTDLTNQTQKAIATMDNETKLQLQAIDAQAKSLLQTSQGASNAYAQTAQNISAIQNNQNLNGDAKRQAINNELALLRRQLQTLSKIDTSATTAVQTPEQVRALELNAFWDKFSV